MDDAPDNAPNERGPTEPAPPTTDIPVASPRRAAVVLTTALYATIVIGAWVVLQLWGLGREPFYTKGEPREGLVVWEMTHDGGWILPRRNGTELPSKPPLFHWLGALTSLAHGVTDEWSIRFPSAALSLLGLLGVFAAGCALWSPRAGLISALTLMTMFEWARAATNARVDMTLTVGLEVAFLSLLFFLREQRDAWLVPLYLGIAWAVLGKGPVGVALPGLVALVIFGLTRDFSPVRRMRLVAGTVTVTLIAGSWYVLALLLGGWAFFRKQILAENVFTFLDVHEFGSGGHRHSALYLFGALLAGVLPWTIFLPGVVARLWRERRGIPMRDARIYLVVWSVVVFGFYAVAASKRSVYLLGFYPAIALLLGWWWDVQSQTPATEERWLARALPAIGWALLGILTPVTLLIGLESVGAPIAAGVGHWLPSAAQAWVPVISTTVRDARAATLGLLLLTAAAVYLLIRSARAAHWVGIFAAVMIATSAGLTLVRQVFLPAVARHQTLRTFMAEVRQTVGGADDVAFYKSFDYGAVFYWQGHIPAYTSGTPRFLLLATEQWERMEPTLRSQYEPVRYSGEPDHGRHGQFVLLQHVNAE